MRHPDLKQLPNWINALDPDLMQKKLAVVGPMPTYRLKANQFFRVSFGVGLAQQPLSYYLIVDKEANEAVATVRVYDGEIQQVWKPRLGRLIMDGIKYLVQHVSPNADPKEIGFCYDAATRSGFLVIHDKQILVQIHTNDEPVNQIFDREQFRAWYNANKVEPELGGEE